MRGKLPGPGTLAGDLLAIAVFLLLILSLWWRGVLP